MDTIDTIDPILQPFDGDRLVGEDLRHDISPKSIYFRLRDARAEARAEERAADNDPSLGEGTPSQWKVIRELALEALQSHSKDIEIACWLTEALTRHDGLTGLADGADLLAGLISRFWDDGLYPTPEDDAPEDRLIAITGMSGLDRDGSLLQPLRKIALFERPDGTAVTIWDFERARDFAALAASRTSSDDDDETSLGGGPSFLDLEADARGPGQDALRTMARDVRRAEASWKALEETIEHVAEGDAAPSTNRVRVMIESLRRLVERYVPEAPAAEAEPAADEAVAMDAAAEAAPAVDGAAAPLTVALAAAAKPVTRDALLDELLRIASLFRRSEPNSPLSFAVEEAVRRARLPWPELLKELLPDAAARRGVLAVTGMRSSKSNDEGGDDEDY